jgi:hypothetical protein
MVVDDEISNRKFLQILLKRGGQTRCLAARVSPRSSRDRLAKLGLSGHDGEA